MDEVFKDPVQLSKGINVKDLITSNSEFHIDVDFKKKQAEPTINFDNDLLSDEDDSDTGDILENIEDSVSKMMLSSPEYHSFKELGAKMIDCVPSGKVKMLIMEEGDGPIIPLDADVTIHYAAYWEKASLPFDSTLTMNNGAPVKLRLGSGRILPGLEIGLTSVKGPTASFNDLPSSEQSKYEVTIKTVNSLHALAKDLFAKKKYMKAIKNYQQSISVLNISEPKDENEELEVKKLKINACLNLAVCYYKVSKPKYVLITLESLDRIIDVDTHCKALFYYARAYEMLNKIDDAVTYYKKALKLEPKNKEIGRALADLDAREKNAAKNEKEMWQNAFSAPDEKKEKKFCDVDITFQNDVREMCQDMAARTEYSKFDLAPGLTKKEVDCIKSIASEFKHLIVDENEEGSRKRVTIVKRMA